MKKSERIAMLNDALTERFGDGVIARADIQSVADDLGVGYPSWIFGDKSLRVGRGMYQLNAQVTPITAAKKPAPAPVTLSAETTGFTENLVPVKDDLYVPFGNYNMVRDVIRSKMFYPLYITGLSGNGKTFGVEQACAATKREVIRVNFTVETDEDDLIGGFRLVDGETKFFHGPAISNQQPSPVDFFAGIFSSFGTLGLAIGNVVAVHFSGVLV